MNFIIVLSCVKIRVVQNYSSMLRTYLCLFFFSLSIGLCAQKSVTFMAYHFEEHSLQKILNPQTRLREAPDLKSPVVDTLEINSVVRILKELDNHEQLGERIAPWYKVAYNKDGNQKTAYVWGGNLALGNIIIKNTEFLYGLIGTTMVTNEEYEMTFPEVEGALIAVENNIMIAKATFPMGNMENSSYGEFSFARTTEFTGVDGIFSIASGGEACGIASYNQLIFWLHGRFYVLPKLVNMFDADVFEHSEHYIFPKESGKPNSLIKSIEVYESDEEGKEIHSNKKEFYKWNGAELISVPKL